MKMRIILIKIKQSKYKWLRRVLNFFLHAVFSFDHPSEDGSGFKFKYV